MAIPYPPLCVLHHTGPVKLRLFHFVNGFGLAEVCPDFAVVACTEYGGIHGWRGYDSIDGLSPGPIRFPLEIQDPISRKMELLQPSPPGLNSCVFMGYILPGRG